LYFRRQFGAKKKKKRNKHKINKKGKDLFMVPEVANSELLDLDGLLKSQDPSSSDYEYTIEDTPPQSV
jgi:hypothetical protein